MSSTRRYEPISLRASEPLPLDRGARDSPIATQDMRIDESANAYGFQMVPVILDGEVCVKLTLGGEWIATAQYM